MVPMLMSTQPTATSTSPIQDFLQELHARHAELREGQVATYIPELAKANPDCFGISLVTTGGHIYEAGDSRQPFTIQSISKPFVYGLALEDNTRAEVLKKISVEPTGSDIPARWNDRRASIGPDLGPSRGGPGGRPFRGG